MIKVFQIAVSGIHPVETELIDPDGCGRLACLQRDFRTALPVGIGVCGDHQRASFAFGDLQPRCTALETPFRIGPDVNNLRLPAVLGKGAHRIAQLDVMLLGSFRPGRTAGKQSRPHQQGEDSK